MGPLPDHERMALMLSTKPICEFRGPRAATARQWSSARRRLLGVLSRDLLSADTEAVVA